LIAGRSTCTLLAQTMIEVDTVAKRFGSTEALAGVSLAVERGKMLALLGPNGAGKTTLRRGRLSAANRSNATRFRSPAPSALPSHTPCQIRRDLVIARARATANARVEPRRTKLSDPPLRDRNASTSAARSSSSRSRSPLLQTSKKPRAAARVCSDTSCTSLCIDGTSGPPVGLWSGPSRCLAGCSRLAVRASGKLAGAFSWAISPCTRAAASARPCH
jgi:hypothetical protein